MRTWYEYSDVSPPVSTDDGVHRYGIEIEVEHADNGYARFEREVVVPHRWSHVEDGSLRGYGRELISPPSTLAELEVALPVVYNCIRLGRWRSSVRTGIHVHIDMSWYTLEQIAAVCAMYSLLEPALYAKLPHDREQGIYCVPWYRAPDEASRLSRAVVRNNSGSARILRDGCKYTGLNVAALSHHNTLEFRMAPTFGTCEELLAWIETLTAVVNMGLSLKTADNVLHYVSAHGLSDLWDSDDVDTLCEEHDGFYCAEILGGKPVHTWDVPKLDFDKASAEHDDDSLVRYGTTTNVVAGRTFTWSVPDEGRSLFTDELVANFQQRNTDDAEPTHQQPEVNVATQVDAMVADMYEVEQRLAAASLRRSRAGTTAEDI